MKNSIIELNAFGSWLVGLSVGWLVD